MLRRWIAYTVVIVVAVPTVVWLAFGGGVPGPLDVFTSPVRPTLQVFNPQAGSDPPFSLGAAVFSSTAEDVVKVLLVQSRRSSCVHPR